MGFRRERSGYSCAGGPTEDLGRARTLSLRQKSDVRRRYDDLAWRVTVLGIHCASPIRDRMLCRVPSFRHPVRGTNLEAHVRRIIHKVLQFCESMVAAAVRSREAYEDCRVLLTSSTSVSRLVRRVWK